MKVAIAKLVSFLLTYAGFALFQAVAVRQPLANRLIRLGPHAPAFARLVALAFVLVACLALRGTLGWAEACLLTAVELVLVAGVFVLLAPALPRVTWGLAILSPLLAAALAIGSRWLS